MGTLLQDTAVLKNSLEKMLARIEAEKIVVDRAVTCTRNLLLASEAEFDTDRQALRGVKRAKQAHPVFSRVWIPCADGAPKSKICGVFRAQPRPLESIDDLSDWS